MGRETAKETSDSQRELPIYVQLRSQAGRRELNFDVPQKSGIKIGDVRFQQTLIYPNAVLSLSSLNMIEIRLSLGMISPLHTDWSAGIAWEKSYLAERLYDRG
jgi:hypothetical protein